MWLKIVWKEMIDLQFLVISFQTIFTVNNYSLRMAFNLYKHNKVCDLMFLSMSCLQM